MNDKRVAELVMGLAKKYLKAGTNADLALDDAQAHYDAGKYHEANKLATASLAISLGTRNAFYTIKFAAAEAQAKAGFTY